MVYIKKIIFLCLKALKTMAFLIRERLEFIEVKILCTGLLLLSMIGLFLLYLLFMDFSLHKTLTSAAIFHLIGGRAMGIGVCLSSGISPFYTILYNFILEVDIVLIAYGVVVLIMRNIIEPKIFRAQVRQAEFAAQGQKKNIKKYGGIGLFFFVMFPFLMTGPVIGAIIGYLLNYKAINNFLIVFSGTLTSLVIYTLIGNNIMAHINQYIEVDMLRKWIAIVVGIAIVIFLIYHFKTVKRFLDNITEED